MRRAVFLLSLAFTAFLFLFLGAPAHAYPADVGAPGAHVLAQLQAPAPALLPDSPAAVPDFAADPEAAALEGVQLLARGGAGTVTLSVLSLALLVLTSVHMVRVVGVRWWPWLGTDRGGALLSLVTGVAGSVLTAASAGVTWTPISTVAVLALGLSGSWTASGMHSQVRRLAGRSRAQAAGEGARAA